MSIGAFDLALKNKCSRVFPNVEVAHEDKIEDAADENGELKLPLISIWRLGNPINFKGWGNESVARIGSFFSEGEIGIRIKALPVNIQYQISIISDRRREVDDIFRELAMFLHEEDSLTVSFLGNEGEEPIKRDFTVLMLDNNDTTDYASFKDRGRLYKEVINIEIPNAMLIFESKEKTVLDIPVRIYTMEDEENEDY